MEFPLLIGRKFAIMRNSLFKISAMRINADSTYRAVDIREQRVITGGYPIESTVDMVR